MFRVKYLVFTLLLAFLAGCSSQKQEQAQAPQEPPAAPEAAPSQPPAAQPTEAQPAGAPAQAPQAAKPAKAPAQAPHEAVAPAAKVPAEPPKPVYAVVPAGTRVEVRLLNAIGSAESKDGDTFSATLDQDLTADGKVIAPRGSSATGKVISATPSGRVKGRANMAIALTEIQLKSATYPIQTNTLSFEAEGTKKKDALKVGGGAGIGAAIGAIAGGGKGAAIGAAIGAGAGTATVLATKGKEVKLGAEDKLSFVLREDLQVRLR